MSIENDADLGREPEGTIALPHLTTEFFIWLWYASEREGGTMMLPDNIGVIDVWVEERLSFRGLEAEKARAVVSGENTSTSLEARAALTAGKVVRDIQMHLRREEREYSVTLRGVNLDLGGAKLPPNAGADGGEDGLLYERMYLYEDLWFIIEALYRRFARERTHADWPQILAAMRGWVGGAPADAFPAPELPDLPDRRGPPSRAAAPATDEGEGEPDPDETPTTLADEGEGEEEGEAAASA